MTELEEKLLKKVKAEITQDLIQECREIETDSNYIKMLVFIDGVPDFLIFDKQKDKFVKLRYHYGLGDGCNLLKSDTEAYFDNYEMREIEL